ncbi:MAG TPA: DUF6368 family protein [Polyangiaceae bacterium]
MPGPTATILFAESTTCLDEDWDRTISARAIAQESFDFWISVASVGLPDRSLPFYARCYHIGAADWDLAGDEASAIEAAFGFVPQVQISVGAMCRDRSSDRILGELAVAILREHRGVLMFDGLLAPTLDPHKWKLWYALRAIERVNAFSAAVGVHPGRIVAATLDGDPSCHIVDLEFLTFWMTHEAFHFVN